MGRPVFLLAVTAARAAACGLPSYDPVFGFRGLLPPAWSRRLPVHNTCGALLIGKERADQREARRGQNDP